MSKEEAQERVRNARLVELGGLLPKFAHEVRNPLSTIGLNLQLVQEDFRDPQTARDRRTAKRLGVVQQEVARLQEILESFLGFVRVPELEIVPVELNALLGELADFLQPKADAAGVLLRLYTWPDLPRVLADAKQIRAAVLNLALNALDACGPGDQILIASQREGAMGLIRVIDTGVGMPSEVLEKAFTPYYTTKKHGTGLGLPTVRNVVEAHGGTLDLRSEPGRGTQFTLAIPLTRQLTAGEDERGDPGEAPA